MLRESEPSLESAGCMTLSALKNELGDDARTLIGDEGGIEAFVEALPECFNGPVL